MTGEFDLLGRLRGALPTGPAGETWIGDDAAVVEPPPASLLLAADVLVEGVHFDLALSTPADVGWKAIAANVSDVAAMGGRPLHVLVSVVAGSGFDVEDLYEGIKAATQEWGCAVAGGDLSTGGSAAVAVAITGTTDGRAPVLRSGARAGDAVVVTGPLGGAAAGLRLLRAEGSGDGSLGSSAVSDAVARHRRPRARPAAGQAASRAGATAMIDVSDGLAADLGHILDASGVGVELDGVPAHPAARPEEAQTGGDDYELVICTPDPEELLHALRDVGAEEAQLIGRCHPDGSRRTLAGEPMASTGWEHTWQ